MLTAEQIRDMSAHFNLHVGYCQEKEIWTITKVNGNMSVSNCYIFGLNGLKSFIALNTIMRWFWI